MGFIALLRSAFSVARVSDETAWHKRRRAPLFSKTIDGRPIGAYGQIWRRKRNGRWEYEQDPETDEDLADRAW